VAEGRYEALDRPRRLSFTLSPLDASGAPLFVARHDVTLTRRRGGATGLRLQVGVSDARPEAAAALAGQRLGWEQALAQLAAAVG
jgi:uncharacterized protein YndB with AHSA1/START domain